MGKDWSTGHSEHALACAIYGDCIYDVVKAGAQNLEQKWVKLTKPWDSLIDKAVRGSFMGLGAPLVSRDWLNFLLFRKPHRWPKGLSKEETELLRLAQAVEEFHPSSRRGGDLPDSVPDEVSLQAMKKYAALFKKEVGVPMWRAYLSVTKDTAREIAPLCEETYGEACTEDEATGIFQGDLERGWKMRSLEVGPPFYRAFPRFIDWISS